MNTTLSPVTVQRFSALQAELIALLEQDYTGLTPKLEQIIRAFEFTQIELAVYRDRGYAQGRGVGQPEADRCALACAFLAKAVLDLKTTRALMERMRSGNPSVISSKNLQTSCFRNQRGIRNANGSTANAALPGAGD